MNTLVKVLLALVAAVIAIKLAGVILALGILAALPIGVVILALCGSAAVLLCIGLALVAGTAPIWVPLLACLGIVSLYRKSHRTSGAA
jgi:hypothetical protein